MLRVALSLIFLLGMCTRGSAQDAVAPERAALRELHTLQLQVPDLWRQRSEQCVGCGVGALLAGVPVAAIMIPFGSLIYAYASSDHYVYGDYGYHAEERENAKSERRLGGALIGIGVLGVAAMGWGIWKIVDAKRARRAIERDLGAIAARRSYLELVVEGIVFGRPIALGTP